MTDAKKDPIPNTRLTSTTWETRLVKKVVAPAGEGQASVGGRNSRKRRRQGQGEAYRRRAQVVLWFRGGPTCTVIATCNGETRRFDGDAEVFSLLQWAGWAQGLH